MALNHIDEGRKTTDIYIEKDWAIIDEVQEAVVSLLRAEKSPRYIPASGSSLLLRYINLPVLRE